MIKSPVSMFFIDLLEEYYNNLISFNKVYGYSMKEHFPLIRRNKGALYGIF